MAFGGVDVATTATILPVAYFEFDDERIMFRLDALNWRVGKAGDQWKIPPCLQTTGERVEVEAELIKLSRVFGPGSDWLVVAVSCPSG